MLGRTNTGGGGGGGGLNFKVICGTQPSTAKENTIWVDTNKINNYYFSATQPEDMAEYDVWFPTDLTSTVVFNALKKNSIMVYPIGAKQVQADGSLANVEAYVNQDGEWMQFAFHREYIIQDGVELVEHYSLHNSTLKTTNGIWKLTSSSSKHFAANYKLDGYGGKRIFVEVVAGKWFADSGYTSGILVNTSPITSNAGKPAYVAQTLFNNSSGSSIKPGIYELKIPSGFLTGYFSIHAEPDETGNIQIKNAWFE